MQIDPQYEGDPNNVLRRVGKYDLRKAAFYGLHIAFVIVCGFSALLIWRL